MQKIIIAVSAVGMTLASAVAMSKCPEGLDAEALMECITVEGAGRDYQEWRKQYQPASAAHQSDAQTDKLNSTKTGVIANN